ncbi:UPF0235 protein C15orf40 [Caerostris extrusa]|uniref:UPF0235 protein C15orf40 n=1 Tax=Caerostris extrusa TaxID=172846 RepID=A0AAV4NFU4_CAEEX|nr:UPF0235 protein C15orf40 [Caerostris extrusa]
MPKKTATKGKVSDKNQASSKNKNGAVYCGTNNEIIIKVHAKPGAKESKITDVGEESVGIQISAPPVDGEANKELLRHLGEILNLKKSELSLEKQTIIFFFFFEITRKINSGSKTGYADVSCWIFSCPFLHLGKCHTFLLKKIVSTHNILCLLLDLGNSYQE